MPGVALRLGATLTGAPALASAERECSTPTLEPDSPAPPSARPSRGSAIILWLSMPPGQGPPRGGAAAEGFWGIADDVGTGDSLCQHHRGARWRQDQRRVLGEALRRSEAVHQGRGTVAGREATHMRDTRALLSELGSAVEDANSARAQVRTLWSPFGCLAIVLTACVPACRLKLPPPSGDASTRTFSRQRLAP